MTIPQPLETRFEVDPLEDLRKPLTDLCEEYIKRECLSEKSKRYLQIRRVNQYMEGNQFGAMAADPVTGTLDYTAVGSSTFPGTENAERSGLYDYNFGIIAPYGDKYSALLGGKPFYNSAAEPKNPTREADRRAARSANIIREWLSACWHLPTLNVEYFSRLWDSSEVYGYLQYASDERVFGKVDVPQYEEREVELESGGFLCRNCGTKSPAPQQLNTVDPLGVPGIENVCPVCKNPLGDFTWQEPTRVTVPEFVGVAKFPQSGPVLTLTTASCVTVAPDLKRFEECPYLEYTYEEHKGVLLDFFGEDLRKLVNENSGEVRGGSTDTNGQGKQTRLSEFSQNGTVIQGLTNRWTFSRTWLKPSMYEYITKKETREALRADYPSGVKISAVDGVIVRLQPEDLHDVWTVGVPSAGKSIQHKALAWKFLGHQDGLNDIMNMLMASVEHGLPSFIYRSNIIDHNAIGRKSYLPQEAIPALPDFGGSLADSIVKLPVSSFPEHALQLPDMIKNDLESASNLTAVAYGGATGGRKTALEAQQMMQQALQVLGTPGMYCSKFWAQIWDMAVRMVAREAQSDIEVSVKSGGVSSSEVVDLEALKDGEYTFKAEVGIPMSLGERQDRIDTIISQSPAIAEGLGLAPAQGQPYQIQSNVGVLRDYLLPGMSDLQIPGEAEWNYTKKKIQQLLVEQPQIGPDGVEAPSQQPEEFVVNYATEAQNVGQWCLSEQGQREAEKNKLGYRNVVLYGKACSILAAPPPMPEQQGGAPPPSNSEQIEEPQPQ